MTIANAFGMDLIRFITCTRTIVRVRVLATKPKKKFYADERVSRVRIILNDVLSGTGGGCRVAGPSK